MPLHMHTAGPRSKAAAKAAAAKQDLFKSLMRARLPPVNFYVEQECEGVMKPDTWGSVEDPFDAETDDEEAEEFNHMYYNIMYDLACAGNPWAQKEYSAMLKRINRLRKTFKKAFHAEDVERVVGGGYEGYVAEGLDLGPTFDPEDYTNHRYVYCVPEADIAIMPTLDYYGYEHEDAINGFVAEFDGQPGNRDGWGGFPLNLHLAIEKDKTNMCLQGEGNFSVIHNVPPFGSRHITQVNGAFEMLRPTIKDVLYQLEMNTFKDGVLRANDHAGAGLMMARLGEGGKLNKGPMGMGLRLQETMRLGAFKVDACASKVTTESAGGASDQAWGARAFVLYDHIPGLGMIFDFYQQRTKEDAPFVGGWAGNFTYDFEMLGATCGLELDYIPGQNVLHVDANVFSGKDYKLAWLLLLPAWNLLKGIWQALRRKPEDEMEMVEEEEEEDDGMGGGGMDAAAMQKMMQQMMAMQGR
ncbi:hypothetical protein DUNSADRAFT_8906 [Dunaliella salina]|uniref:Translocase of chloroplast 159/132 membrane anchor domain-containing protein n=1 Tax=Dunaliella salina TaxID=3046 RepID=A0ABQ7GIN0_DUNSA|nr:hypothetical protein DUNSADRAFT_8906 [Dunaliella salina]|eukprot:KAF5834443.1 hypothetical protein DUNSADRAFT_8906 [Dunaliella salina]